MSALHHRHRAAPDRRAVALLIVLGIVVIMTVLVTTIAHRQSILNMQAETSPQGRVLDDITQALDEAVLTWLATESNMMVLPPDIETPRVSVLADEIQLDSATIRVHASAWDERAMVPIDGSGRLTAFGNTLTADTRRQLQRVVALGGQWNPALTPDLYPPHETVAPAQFGNQSGENHANLDTARNRVTLWACVAAIEDGLEINVNTAPEPLLRQAMRAAGRGGIEQILTARAEQRLHPLSNLPALHGDIDRDVQLTAASDRWAIRLDLDVRNERGIVIAASRQWQRYHLIKDVWIKESAHAIGN